jgi:murein DD-endopeptidase MepM/ murein hydrolase activator NlpD
MFSHAARRGVLLAIVMIVVSLVPSGTARAGTCWRPPVSARVREPYREPACRWCPGHRGIEYGTAPGTAVHAVATGRVTFVGTVAGTDYVVVRHADGLRVTYGNVSNSALEGGALVVRGVRIGATVGALHFGVRRGDRYVDPAPLLGTLTYSPRLIPIDGAEPAAARPPRLRCTSERSLSRKPVHPSYNR